MRIFLKCIAVGYEPVHGMTRSERLEYFHHLIRLTAEQRPGNMAWRQEAHRMGWSEKLSADGLQSHPNMWCRCAWISSICMCWYLRVFNSGKEVKEDFLEKMVSEAPGPINFTMFLTLFGEKLTGTDPEEVESFLECSLPVYIVFVLFAGRW